MSATVEHARPPSIAAVTTAVAVALAILIALFAMAFAFAHASIGAVTQPPATDSGAG